eukprot:CAMPEP_0172926322 /NCGR_PEP_ID=MMETSP1075-20121228/215396_1 /TAXON_ID=2916 /ORGANISM="Ceratium fusus, Strain PA161109" /LENGTH=249 /DNA_ID=CAMNT_0013787369 /DNA_START=93 /DNA_END=839 /DNA_ORIENTATION=-
MEEICASVSTAFPVSLRWAIAHDEGSFVKGTIVNPSDDAVFLGDKGLWRSPDGSVVFIKQVPPPSSVPSLVNGQQELSPSSSVAQNGLQAGQHLTFVRKTMGKLTLIIKGTQYTHPWGTTEVEGNPSDIFRVRRVPSGSVDDAHRNLCSTKYGIDNSGCLEQSRDDGKTWTHISGLSCGNNDWHIQKIDFLADSSVERVTVYSRQPADPGNTTLEQSVCYYCSIDGGRAVNVTAPSGPSMVGYFAAKHV